MEYLLLWPIFGAFIHIIKATNVGTYFGEPIWRHPSTYVMFLPAMIAGPFMLIILVMDS